MPVSLANHGPHRLGVGLVGLNSQGAHAERLDLASQLLGLGGRGRVAEDDVGTLASQPQRDGFPVPRLAPVTRATFPCRFFFINFRSLQSVKKEMAVPWALGRSARGGCSRWLGICSR